MVKNKTPLKEIESEVAALATRVRCRPGGLRPLLAFGGFGQRVGAWQDLQAVWQRHYTVWTWDGWGHTDAPPPDQPALQTALAAFIRARVDQKVTLVGFSLGCRPVLLALEACPGHIEAVHLLAPEVLHPGFWFRTATGSAAGRWLLARALAHPTCLHRLLRRGGRRAAASGAVRQVATAGGRRRVLRTWLAYGRWHPDLSRAAGLLRDHGIALTVWTGAHDALAPPAAAAGWLRRVPHGRLVVLPTHHADLPAAVADRWLAETDADQRPPATPSAPGKV